MVDGCRMYEERFPEVDDVVMVQVKSIAEMGAYVTLLEYNNIEGTWPSAPRATGGGTRGRGWRGAGALPRVPRTRFRLLFRGPPPPVAPPSARPR